ncbi:MAG: DEAD/DEAH box helicase, partial [Rhodospirillales bacterium]|nr:DEAD/DEAH box helicase [Rhodospirillales bacterium]
HLLICSDVAARGLDIPDLSHVFNYDVPTHAEDYVHRIGRTGRAGKEGKAFTIATKEDGKYINEIETLIGLKIPGLDQAKKARPAAEEAMPVKAKPAKEKPVEDKVAEDTAVESAEPEAPVQEPPKEIKEEPKQAKPVAESKPKRQRNRDRDRSAKQPEPEKNRNSGSNVGMGDHTPAFLLRPVKTSS